MHKKYTLPLKLQLLRIALFLGKIPLKFVVLYYVLAGKEYPAWMVTPDDPVSPFGSGTTPGASYEPSQVALYKRFGKKVGDFVWLGWRNAGYGLSYRLKPEWLKDPNLKYRQLTISDSRVPHHNGGFVGNGYVERTDLVGTVKVLDPNGKWLCETTRKIGPFFLVTGFRVSPIASGAREDWMREITGRPLAGRPLYHPNMDGRPIVSIRLARTL